MTRFKYIWGVAGLAGVVSVLALVASAAPAGATLVCPKGVTNPKYCTNVPPIATTSNASDVRAERAVLNGVSGPNVAGGDVTQYFFQYGLSSVTYGKTTPTGTIGSCPPGVGKPTYCPGVPAQANVSANISGLTPCTTYHFRIVSQNPDGKTNGNDVVFTTRFENPIVSVKIHPTRVKHRHRFKVTIKLKLGANVKIFLRRKHKDVKSVDLGFHNPGTFSRKIRAPRQKGLYVVRVVAKTSCGKQTKDKRIRVH